MKTSDRSPLSAGRPLDDLDGLLRAYYQAELPQPWPSLQPPTTVVDRLPLPRRAWTGSRGRFVLAASLLALLVGQLFLSGRFATHGTKPTGVIADDAKAHRLVLPKEKPSVPTR